jgi:hypothetical protein
MGLEFQLQECVLQHLFDFNIQNSRTSLRGKRPSDERLEILAGNASSAPIVGHPAQFSHTSWQPALIAFQLIED